MELALLQDDDLSGWSEIPLDDTLLWSNTGVICDGEVLVDKSVYLDRAGIEFRQSAWGPFLLEMVFRLESPDAAKAAMDFARKAYGCSQWSAGTVESSQVIADLSPFDVPSLGDEITAMRAQVYAGNGATVQIDQFYARVGSVVTSFGIVGSDSIDEQEEIELARLLVDKIRAAGY